MSIKLLDIVLAALFLVFGLYVIGSAFAFGITSDTGPGSGTFPLIAGLLMAIFAGGTLYRALRSGGNPDAAIGLAEVVKVAGLLALLGLYIAAFEPLGAFLPLPFLIIGSSLVIHWRTDPMWLVQLLALAVGFAVVCYFVFAVFLRVLLPTGPLGF